MNQEQSPLISTQKAAQELGVHPSTLRKWANRGKLPFHKVGKVYKFVPSDVETFIAKTRVDEALNANAPSNPVNQAVPEQAVAAREGL
jgi:excisionase family DNA binding protein